MNLRVVPVVLGLAVVTAFGCDPNITGRLAAERHGDRLDALASRASPWEGLASACSSPEPPMRARNGILDRAPYIQLLQPRSASILWTQRTTAAATLELSDVDGRHILTAGAQPDPGAEAGDSVQYAAQLQGLEPSTTYCYTVSVGERRVAGPVGFRTAPSQAQRPISFVVFGDSGYGGSDQYALRRQLDTVDFDLMLVTGDVAYTSGTLSQLEANFFDVYDPLLRALPAFPTSGNHDYATDDAEPFRDVFALPENGGDEGRERWFSFDWGPAHFVALDTQHTGAAQAAWLEADLAANERPWVIVYAHHSPYSSGHHGSDQGFRQWFRPILERYQVPLVFTGHDHHYERSIPIEGTTYVVTGGGGRGVRIPDGAPFTAFAEGVIHFVYVTIEGDTLRMHAIDGTGTEFDAAEIRLGSG